MAAPQIEFTPDSRMPPSTRIHLAAYRSATRPTKPVARLRSEDWFTTISLPAMKSLLAGLAFLSQLVAQVTVTSNSPLPSSIATAAYSFTLSASGGTAPYVWIVLGGQLPAGLGLAANGVISGTASTAGVSSFTLQVSDSSSPASTISKSFSLTIAPKIKTVTDPLTVISSPSITDPSPLPSGAVQMAYSYQFGSSPVSGGTPPYTWSNLSNLPPGLGLSAGGILAGTPTDTGLFTFSIQVKDSIGATGSKTFALPIGTAPVLVSKLGAPPPSTVGVPYPPPPPAAQPPYFKATQGTGTYSWTSSGLPEGLTVNPATGALTGISGVPAASGTFAASVTATDPVNEMGTASFSLTINPAPSINTGPLTACTAGSPCTRTLSVSGGTPPFAWTLASGALPPGVSLSPAGVIGGVPGAVSSPTTFVFGVKATDSATASDTKQFSLVVNPGITISPSSLPATTSGLAYSQTFTATGGSGAVTFTATGLPSWLALTTGGLLSGTAPSVSGPFSYPFTVIATDSSSGSGSAGYSVLVNPLPSITNASPLPSGTVNRPYSLTLAATGGTGALTFSDTGPPPTLPVWLSISGAGVLSGTPPTTGVFSFTLKVADSLSAFSTKAFTLTINPPPSVTTTSLPATTSGATYSQTLAESGGTSPFTWQATGLPGWLTLSAAGVLSGTAPVVSGSTPFPFSVTVTDAAGSQSLPQNLSVTVNPAVQITTASPLPPTESGLSYSQTFTSSGGTGAVTWTSGNLPAWLTLSPAGVLSGIAPAVASATPFSFTVTAKDSVGATGEKNFSVTVNPAVTITTTSPLPPWTVKQPYSQSIAAAGGIPGYTFTDAGATLPQWLTISAGGALTGTPPAAGTFDFSLKVTDSIGGTNTKGFELQINSPPSVSTTSLPATTSGLSYSQTLTESGGTPGFTFAAASLPGWLTLAGATLSGTAPPVSGPIPYNFSVTVTDGAGAVSAAQPLSVTVNPVPVIVTSNPLPSAASGAFYSQTFSATGGTGTITWTFGGLPAWLSQSGATVSGTTPALAQSTPYTFTATASDSLGATSGSHSFTVTVIPGVVITTGSSLGPWTALRPYTVALAAAGGTPPYTFSDAGQTLPQWLTLTGNVLSGTPPSAGPYSFTIRAVDSLNSATTKQFTLSINPVPSITATSLPPITSGLQYSQPLAVSGGTAPFTWSGTNLPPWLTFNGSSLVGTAPLVSGATQFSFSVSLIDAAGATAGPQPLTVTVNPPVSITTTSPLPPATPGIPYSVSFTASGGTGALTWTSSNLPSWLTLSGSILSGTPPASAVGSTPGFTIRATDTLGAFDSRDFQVTVGPLTNTGTLPPWTVNRPYSTSLTVSGGTPPYKNWLVTGGAAPAGLQLNFTTGVIAGTPSVAGTSSFTVSATDANGQVFQTTWSLTINPALTIPAQTLPPASPGMAYTQTLIRNGGTSPFTWSATGLTGSGLVLTSGGVLTGVPTATPPATISFTATVSDVAGATAQAAFSVTVAPAITITTSSLPATTATAHYSASVSATGGTGTITFSAAPGAPPSWLVLSAQGTFTGIAPTVAVATDFSFIVTAADSVGVTASKTLTVTVNPVPKVLTTTLPVGTAGALYSTRLTASGGTGTLVWSVQNLPSWATLNTSTGVISGTPPAAATVTILVVVTDALGISSQPASLTMEIDAPGGTPHITAACPFGATTAGLALSQTVTAAGGFPPYSWSAQGLPTWLALNSSGALSGTAVAGVTAFTLQATDSKGQVATLGCGLAVNPAPAITATSLALGTVGAPYAQQLIAFGGTGTLTWSSADLPGWLSLEPLTGALSGTPAIAGTYTFTVQVKDSLGAISLPASFTILVTTAGGVPTITACPLPIGAVGAPMTFQLTAALGFAPYRWSVTGLPAGLNANIAGVVSGTPAAATSSNLGLTVTDSVGGVAGASCPLYVLAAPAVTTASLPNGTVGAFYWQPLAASGGVGALRWSISGAPAWLGLDAATGILSGTPPSVGVSSFTVRVTDSQQTSSPDAPLSVTVTEAGGNVTLTTACPLPPITEGVLLSQVFTAIGGLPPYSWSAAGLPAGVSLSPSGSIIGAPGAGSISFTVRATDQRQQQTAALSCSVQVNSKPSIATTSLPDAVAGTPYSAKVTATGGTGLLTWSAAQPYWLNIDSQSGSLSGTPPAPGPAAAVVRVSDKFGISDAKTFPFSIAAPSGGGGSPALTTSCPLPSAIAGVSYSQSLTAGGGSPPYQFFVSGLPVGLTFSSNGALGGTAQSVGSAQLVVEVIDANGKTAITSCVVTVTAPSVLTIVVNTPDGRVNQSYSGGLSATGGLSPLSWSVSSGALPPGVNLNAATGALTGIPTAPGTFSFAVRVTDANKATGSANVSINILPSLTITTPATLPPVAGGSSYRQTLATSGSSGAVTWSIVSGALPAGLTLDATTGVISGSPTQVGTFSFTAQAVDGIRQQTQQKFTLTVTLAPLPQLTIAGFPATLTPNQQPTPTVTLAAPYPLDIMGQLNLTVTADASVGLTDPAVQFSSCCVSVPFRIAANSTQAVFTPSSSLQTGTLAGTLKLDVTLQTGGVTAQPPASAAVTGQIPRLAPVIVGTPTVTRSASGLQVTLVGFATSREVTSATFHFTGTNLQTTDVVVPLTGLVGGWYSSSQSNAYGSLFQIVQPFTIQGTPSQVTGVTITLTNSVGSSAPPVTVTF
jgi:large repetitive protein